SVLRLIEEEAMKDRTARVLARLPVEVSSFLLNEKRTHIATLEARCRVGIVVVPEPHFDTPFYELKRIRDDQLDAPGNNEITYRIIGAEEEHGEASTHTDAGTRATHDEPAVSNRSTQPRTVAPSVGVAINGSGETGSMQKLWKALKTLFAPTESTHRDSARSGESGEDKPARQNTSGRETPPRRERASSARTRGNGNGNSRSGRGRSRENDDSSRRSHASGNQNKGREKDGGEQTAAQAAGSSTPSKGPDASRSASDEQPRKSRSRRRGGRR